MAVREDDSEEITKNIEGNLKEDTKSSTSREEEIPQEEEDNLNKSSGEDKEMYSWDELEYKANYARFISNESTERQVQIASVIVNKLEEPVYNHRTSIKERSRPLRKCNDNQPISVLGDRWNTSPLLD